MVYDVRVYYVVECFQPLLIIRSAITQGIQAMPELSCVDVHYDFHDTVQRSPV